MRRWSERSLRNLAGIHPDLRRVMDRALVTAPVDFVVIEGLRTRERQAELVRAGVSWTMNSRHLTGHAVDLWPIDPSTGRASTNDDKTLWWLYRAMAPAIKEAAAAEGVAVAWGGDWTRRPDGPHWELSWHHYPADAPWPDAGVQTVAAGLPQPGAHTPRPAKEGLAQRIRRFMETQR